MDNNVNACNKQNIEQKHDRELFICAVSWLDLLEQGADLYDYFVDHGCKSVAIYGAGDLGKTLLREFRKHEGITVSFFLDLKGKGQAIDGIPVYSSYDYATLPRVDIVVVTAFTYFSEISNYLLKIRPETPVVSLKKIIEVRSDEVWENEYANQQS